ncbi:MAG: hypothetical protein ACK2UY_05215 [Anaerolineae bacterium]|jgi:hypothetical protein
MNRQSLRLLGAILALVSLLALLAGCGGSIVEPPTPTPEVFNPLPPEQRAFAAAREALARQLGLDPLAIQLVETVPVDWPDACLGLPAAGESCAEVITPGFRVIVETGGTSYEFHTDGDGSLVRGGRQS